MDMKMRRWIIAIFMMVVMIESVTALCWNPLELFCIFENNEIQQSNSIIYKDNNMTIEFKEGELVIGQATLKSHKTYDEVREILIGQRTVVWYEFSSFGDVQIDALKGVEFIDMRRTILNYSSKEPLNISKVNDYIVPNPDYLKPINKTYMFVYLGDYEEVHWFDYETFDIPKGNITLGVNIILNWGEHLDVVWDILGNKLDRHALVLGVSSGFVTEAPTSDPLGAGATIDDQAHTTMDTSPESSAKIVEIGWYANSATEETNWEAGLYSADGVTVPGEAGTLLEASRTNAKGTNAGWKTTIVDWDIESSTDYWISIQVDNTALGTGDDYSTSGGSGADMLFGSPTTLPDPFGGGSILFGSGMFAIYAVWEASPSGDTINPIINGIANISLSNIFQNTNFNFTFNITDDSGNVTNGTITINNTGIVQYYNFTFSGSGQQTMSQNFTITQVSGTVINVTGIARDNSSNLAINDTIFTIQLEDTCNPTTPLTADHTFDANDNCVISSVFDAGGFNIECRDIGNGAGTLSWLAELFNYNIYLTDEGCIDICEANIIDC